MASGSEQSSSKKRKQDCDSAREGYAESSHRRPTLSMPKHVEVAVCASLQASLDEERQARREAAKAQRCAEKSRDEALDQLRKMEKLYSELRQQTAKQGSNELAVAQKEREQMHKERDGVQDELNKLMLRAQKDNEDMVMRIYAMTNQNTYNLAHLHSIMQTSIPDIYKEVPELNLKTKQQYHTYLEGVWSNFKDGLQLYKTLSDSAAHNSISDCRSAISGDIGDIPFLQPDVDVEPRRPTVMRGNFYQLAQWFREVEPSDFFTPRGASELDHSIISPEAIKEQSLIAQGVLDPEARAVGMKAFHTGEKQPEK
ncbi:hypothetical protein P280DRAFT_546881 [Massarina eburnea CBS 473.64]|uniref:Uncharacterized protein n=1 Tax=Massarina eburnea CBS 473.64 TaxID=1395130 RepID=A0A6A6S8F2_9PLEO|nr:hypothetical protein P280DRAFT_546881 [Massarina eburnea CBS 473.64]